MEVLNETTRRGCCAKHSGVSRRTRQLELEEGTLRKKKEKKKKTPQKKKFLEVFSHEMVTPTQAEKVKYFPTKKYCPQITNHPKKIFP